MRIFAIDPGTELSQYLILEDGRVAQFGLRPNTEMRMVLRGVAQTQPCTLFCIEMVESYGMAVGREVFETLRWIGRFEELLEGGFGIAPTMIGRGKIKLHLCNSVRAKDGNVRQALLDRFGGREKAVGKKAKPGPLYGVSKHAWAALGLAVTFADSLNAEAA